MLSGHVLDAKPGTRGAVLKDRLTERELQQLKDYSELCASIGESEATVALAWILHNPVVTSVIVGPRTVEQLESSLKAVDLELSEETLKRLDEIFPGYEAAPKSYSW